MATTIDEGMARFWGAGVELAARTTSVPENVMVPATRTGTGTLRASLRITCSDESSARVREASKKKAPLAGITSAFPEATT